MKVGAVKLSQVLASPGMRLDAEYYLCPTKTVDAQIARAETTMRNARARLKKLRAQRREIVAEAKSRGLDVT